MSCKISFPSSTFPYQSRTIIYSLFSLYSRWEIRVFNLWIQSAKLSSQGWARLLRVYDDVVSGSDWNGSCSIIHPQFSSSCPVQPCPSEQLIPSTLNLEQLNNYTFMLLPPFHWQAQLTSHDSYDKLYYHPSLNQEHDRTKGGSNRLIDFHLPNLFLDLGARVFSWLDLQNQCFRAESVCAREIGLYLHSSTNLLDWTFGSWKVLWLRWNNDSWNWLLQ